MPSHENIKAPAFIAQARKAKENPAGAVYGSIKGFIYAATHPIYIVQQASKLVAPAISSFLEAFKLAWWLKDPARGTHE